MLSICNKNHHSRWNTLKFQIRPVVDKVYKMEEIRDAFERVQRGSVIGKLVIEM